MPNKRFENIINSLTALSKKKFAKDTVFLGLSTFFTSLSFILINTVIGKYYGIPELGIFNSCLAIYIILMTAISAGLPNSVLKFCSEKNTDKNHMSNLLISAIILTIFISSTSLLVLFYMLKHNIFLREEYIMPLRLLFYAIPFFAINRCLRSYLNSQRRMLAYSYTEALRWALILTFICCCLILNKNFIFIFYAPIISESILLIILSSLIFSKLNICFPKSFVLYKQHLDFGIKTLLGSLLLMANNKIDILMVSFFTSNSMVGIYSFAAEIAKNLLALSRIIQINFNPIISNLCASKDYNLLLKHIRRIKNIVYKIMLPCAMGSMLVYPLYIIFIMKNPAFYISILVFFIIIIGAGFASIYMWCGSILSMAGYPEDSFKRNLILIISTVLLNILLIPRFGIIGAAFSTSLTFMIRILTLYIFAKKRLNINIITLR